MSEPGNVAHLSKHFLFSSTSCCSKPPHRHSTTSQSQVPPSRFSDSWSSWICNNSLKLLSRSFIKLLYAASAGECRSIDCIKCYREGEKVNYYDTIKTNDLNITTNHLNIYIYFFKKSMVSLYPSPKGQADFSPFLGRYQWAKDGEQDHKL